MDKDGLLISGLVSGRSKRFVGEKNTELVTYKVSAGGRDFYVKDWLPGGVYFDVGDKFVMPVSVKIYSRNGQSSLDFSISKSGSMLGEAF